MLSPAARHRQAATGATPNNSAELATLPAPAAVGTTRTTPNHDRVIVAQFLSDHSHMSHIKSRTRRNAAKRQALATYQTWLDAFAERDDPATQERTMFVWLLVWHIDAGQWERALVLARTAIAEQLNAPKEFERNLAETVCEEIVSGILKGDNIPDYHDLLDALAELLDGQDMSDPITAKLYKARALSMFGSDPLKARELLLKALAFDPKAGVKRHLQALDNLGKPEPVKRPEVLNIQEYSLSARQAAQLISMTAPAFLRHAKKYPALLPRIEIPVGKRNFYRFNPKHVKAYLKQHLVKP